MFAKLKANFFTILLFKVILAALAFEFLKSDTRGNIFYETQLGNKNI